MALHLITNCTSKKTKQLTESISISDIQSREDIAAKEWVEKLSSESKTLPASELYLGDHWSRALEVINYGSKVSIISAGYGLISSSDNLCKYDATFSSGSVNSVSKLFKEASLSKSNYQWWRLVNSLKSQGNNGLIDLYDSNPSDQFIISTSPAYLKVIEPELVKLALSKKLSIYNTAIFSSNQRLNKSLEPFFYKVEDDLCAELGGSRVSLNIRLAAHVIKNISDTANFATEVEGIYREIRTKSEPAIKYDRKKLDDESVSNFIKNFLESSSKAKPAASPILRELRNKGMACEQKRFKNIFESIMQTAQK